MCRIHIRSQYVHIGFETGIVVGVVEFVGAVGLVEIAEFVELVGVGGVVDFVVRFVAAVGLVVVDLPANPRLASTNSRL